MKDPKKPVLTAAEWFLRIENGPLSKAERSEFLAWLRSSPLHVRTYLSAARVARCLPSAYKKGPIQESLIDTLSRAVPEQLDESKRRTWEYEMLGTLKRRLNQSDSPLPGAIRRKGNGVSRDS
jgi:ferric-dicitrate binding protein FerR (iron transport regulator)